MTIEERFFKKVKKTTSCWLWEAGTRGKTGYGSFKYNKKVIDSHRMVWILTFGEIPTGMYICHTCDNRLCVNPSHLFLGTPKDNWLDGVNKGRISLSHPKKFENNYISSQRKIKVEDAKEIVMLYKNTEITQDQLGKRYNISSRAVRYILSGITYKN